MSDEVTLLKDKISLMDCWMSLFKRLPDNSLDPSVLRPIDAKDITKPEPFDGVALKFLAWFAGVKVFLSTETRDGGQFWNTSKP